MSGFITNGELRNEAERLCDENEELKAENEQLRNRIEELESYVTAPPLENQLLEALDENEKLKDYGARLFDKTLELGADNTKLREIARAAWTCINVKNCSECRFISGGCTLYAAMCEMGIGTGE